MEVSVTVIMVCILSKNREHSPAVFSLFFLPLQSVSQQLQRELWDGSSVNTHLQKQEHARFFSSQLASVVS